MCSIRIDGTQHEIAKNSLQNFAGEAKKERAFSQASDGWIYFDNAKHKRSWTDRRKTSKIDRKVKYPRKEGFVVRFTTTRRCSLVSETRRYCYFDSL